MSSPSMPIQPPSTFSRWLMVRSSVDLPEPRRAEDHGDLAGVDRQVDAAQHFQRAEALVDPVDVHHHPAHVCSGGLMREASIAEPVVPHLSRIRA